MTGPLYPQSMAAHRPCRSLNQLLAELDARLKALPLTSPERPALIDAICAVEDELAARAGLRVVGSLTGITR